MQCEFHSDGLQVIELFYKTLSSTPVGAARLASLVLVTIVLLGPFLRSHWEAVAALNMLALVKDLRRPTIRALQNC